MGWIVGIANPEGFDNDHGGEELTEKDLEEQQDISGLPMFDDHDYTKKIGVIEKSWLDKGKLWIMGKIDESIEHGKKAFEKIKSGEYEGLSLGTFSLLKGGRHSNRRIAEASPCKEGKRPGTKIILTCAHKDPVTGESTQVEMDIRPITGVQTIDENMNKHRAREPSVADTIAADIMEHAERWLQSHQKNLRETTLPPPSAFPPRTPSQQTTPSPHFESDPKGSFTGGKSGEKGTEDSSCPNCKRSFENKSNSESGHQRQHGTKEVLKPSILGENSNNRKKTEHFNSTSSSEENNRKTESHSTPESRTPSKKMSQANQDQSHTEEGEGYKPEYEQGPSGGSNLHEPEQTPNPTTPSNGKTDESSFFQEPRFSPGTEEQKKRKAQDQPRNEKGQFEKKPKTGTEEKKKDSSSPEKKTENQGADDLEKFLSEKGGSDSRSVNLTVEQLKNLLTRAKSTDQLKKEKEEAEKQAELFRRRLEERDAKEKRESKHVRVQKILETVQAALKDIDMFKEQESDDKSTLDFWNRQEKTLKDSISDPDALYKESDDNLNQLDHQCLVITRASNTFRKREAEMKSDFEIELKKKYESYLDEKKKFDPEDSGRKRYPSEPKSSYSDLLDDKGQFDGLLDTPSQGEPQSRGKKPQTNSNQGKSAPRQNQRHFSIPQGEYSIPLFYGQEATSGTEFTPIRFTHLCTENDPNKDIFAQIEGSLIGGGFKDYYHAGNKRHFALEKESSSFAPTVSHRGGFGQGGQLGFFSPGF